MLTEHEQRIWDQAHAAGVNQALAGHQREPHDKPKKMDPYERGLRRRALRFRERAALALAAGDINRAARLESWADSEAAILSERFDVSI